MSLKKKTTNLDINYDDTYAILVKHKNGTIGTLHINVVSRVPIRKLLIFDEDKYISWGGTPDSLMEFDLNTKKLNAVTTYHSFDHNEGYAKNIIEDAYLEELNDFIHTIKYHSIPKYSFKKDINILNVIDQIENKGEIN